MAEIVFLRGVNVGGRKLQTSKFAAELKALDMVSIGAAGTFVVRARVKKEALVKEVQGRLPFACDILTCSDKELRALVAAPPFPTRAPPPGQTWYITIINEALGKTTLPIEKPPGKEWQVRILSAARPFVSSLHRRLGRTLIYPNEVVEKSFGVVATTRNWSTILSIAEILANK
jgi:uncharacterized protein (DUF1697 family)